MSSNLSSKAALPRFRISLERITNICIICVALLVAGVISKNTFFPTKPRQLDSPQKGQQIESIASVARNGSERILLIAVSPNCGYCTASFPFYKRILNQRDQTKSNTMIFAAVGRADQLQAEIEVLRSSGVQFDDTVTLDFRSMRVSSTPTLILLNNKGVVLESWMGKLDEKAENKILAAM